MATFMASIVNVALPDISTALNADLPIVQWVVTAYLLAISSLLPVFGKAGDTFGRRRVYGLGFVIFTIGSLLCSLAPNVWLLIAARIVKAVGAAMIMATGPAIVAVAFPGKERGRALGLIGTVVALGSMVGPAVGGLLVGTFGWKLIFYVNLPIGLIGLLGVYFVLPKDRSNHTESFDLPGAVSFATAMTAFLLILSHGREWGWTTPGVLAGMAVTVVSFIIFVKHEQRTTSPMIDLSLFRNWPFTAGNMAGLLSFMAMFSNTILLPFYLHTIMALSPTEIGLVMTAFPLLMAVVAPVSGYLSERINSVILTSTGLALMAIGLTYQATIGADGAVWQIALGQSVMGLGNGLFQSPNNNSVLSSVHPSKLGIASGINALVRNVGMVSGTAIAVTVLEHQRFAVLAGLNQPTPSEQANAFLFGYQSALLVGAAFAAAGVFISLNRRAHIKRHSQKE